MLNVEAGNLHNDRPRVTILNVKLINASEERERQQDMECYRCEW